jgi:hypothetical protein
MADERIEREQLEADVVILGAGLPGPARFRAFLPSQAARLSHLSSRAQRGICF